jgi:hypothetical protein
MKILFINENSKRLKISKLDNNNNNDPIHFNLHLAIEWSIHYIKVKLIHTDNVLTPRLIIQ